MKINGPSDKAREAFHRAENVSMNVGSATHDEMLDAAHDPALGLDRSVCLRDVVEALRAGADAKDPNADAFWFRESADFIEREFGEK